MIKVRCFDLTMECSDGCFNPFHHYTWYHNLYEDKNHRSHFITQLAHSPLKLARLAHFKRIDRSTLDLNYNIMETAIVSNRMLGIIALYDLQTPFFNSVLDGISDKDAHNRLNTKANHIAWLAGSMVQQRFDLAEMFGAEGQKQAAYDLFKDNKGIQEGVTYPSLESYKKDWAHIAPVCREVLAKATDEKLNSMFEMPGMQFPFFDLVTFMTYREANCIGQIALYRRLLGYEAMKYM